MSAGGRDKRNHRRVAGGGDFTPRWVNLRRFYPLRQGSGAQVSGLAALSAELVAVAPSPGIRRTGKQRVSDKKQLCEAVIHKKKRIMTTGVTILLILSAVANADSPSVVTLAERGDPDSQAQLGAMYFYGLGRPRDYIEAERWYRAAAEQGNYQGQWQLGKMYYFGIGVPQDYAEAAHWFRIVAERGDHVRQVQIGRNDKESIRAVPASSER